MVQVVSRDNFREAFRRMGRENQFSHSGLDALYDYLTEYEEGTGQQIELDVIGLCCEFTEYSNLEELKKDYPDIESLEDLEDHTAVIPVDEEGLIIQAF